MCKCNKCCNCNSCNSCNSCNNCDKYNGLFTDRSKCNSFNSNIVIKTKYLGLASQALTVAEAIDNYIIELTDKFANGETTLVLLVNETQSILCKMNKLFPCIHVRNKCTNEIIKDWKWSDTLTSGEDTLPTGLFLLTPETPCGLGPIRINCCPANFYNLDIDGNPVPFDYSTPTGICEIELTQHYIDLWCCTAQHLRSIKAFILEYFSL